MRKISAEGKISRRRGVMVDGSAAAVFVTRRIEGKRSGERACIPISVI